MKTQTEAQRLAFALDGHDGALWVNEAASELRRLEAANAELLEALRYIHGLSLTEDYRDLPAIFGRMREAIAKHGGAA